MWRTLLRVRRRRETVANVAAAANARDVLDLQGKQGQSPADALPFGAAMTDQEARYILDTVSTHRMKQIREARGLGFVIGLILGIVIGVVICAASTIR